MKFAAAALALTSLLALSPSSVLAAPANYTFNVPLDLDFTGTSASGQPITSLQVHCSVLIGNTEFASAKQVFTNLKVSQTITLVAKPTATWMQDPQQKPERWVCLVEYATGGGSTYASDYTAIQGADISKSHVVSFGKL